MIAVGVAAVQRFRPVLLAFAVVLIVSAYKMLQPEGEDEDLKDNMVMKIARRLVNAQDEYDGDKFFSRSTGVRRATPMLVVLICIELSDVIFAVDSIPAVVGITQDPFIVYTSNIFALMALRSLYLILSKSVQQLIYLRHAVATILGFVGVKSACAPTAAPTAAALPACSPLVCAPLVCAPLVCAPLTPPAKRPSHAWCRVAVVAEYLDYHVSSLLSLALIAALLLAGTLASIHHNQSTAANGAGGSAEMGLGSPLSDVV